MAGKHGENLQANLPSMLCDGGDGLFVQGRIFDDSAGADVFAAEFELRLNQDKKYGIGFRDLNGGRQNFCDGDERDVGDDEGDRFGDVGGLQFACVAFDFDDATILLELPGKLRDVDVDGIDARGAVL